ncbi:uncharacterized protein DSM5745_08416 [Aspergillus mulundensis]|uniref:AT hook motif protein n=1 Tax=Aspergillus mulundensis TaxID=1810919 RepID=A0A3D8RA51_9EURO|nr:hypothetical protein DSM5745_08416 [Aspergillus mulundensis]RDW70905.1 hypothetical protein DSM5745_08416 [Aspergillus mulundensis]
MVMTWNAESDARLFLGVLNQLRDAKLKLDNQKLAEFMGPDCLPGAIVNRIARLRRMAEAEGGGSANADGDVADNGDAETTPQVSPQKRKGGRKPRAAVAAIAALNDAADATGDIDTAGRAGPDSSPQVSPQKRKTGPKPGGSAAPRGKKVKAVEAETGAEAEVAVKREEDHDMHEAGDREDDQVMQEPENREGAVKWEEDQAMQESESDEVA